MKDFRPINPHGSKAVPTREPVFERVPLYQVRVETLADQDIIPISPWLMKPVAEAVMASASKAIIDGHRPDWGNPHLAPQSPSLVN